MGLFFDSDEEKVRKRELKEEAEEYRSEARNYISDAKNDIQDFKDLKQDARDWAKSIGEQLDELNQQKVEVLKELDGEISVTIANFKRFNISGRVPKAPNISFAGIPNFSSASLTNAIGGIGSSFSLVNISFSSLSNPERDRDEARRKMREAERYAEKARCVRDQMKEVHDKLENTYHYIQDERGVIYELMDKLRSIIKQFKTAMQQQTHTEKSAKYMEGICKIAEQIKFTLENQVVNDDSGEIQDNYKLYSQRIREINRSIPSAPNISSSSSWLDVVLKY